MDLQQLIRTKLPEDLREIAWKYQIPSEFLEEMPDLIELVLRSKSMDKSEEKQSRFNLMPMMNDEQIQKLRDILDREKKKLAEIEQKYEQKKLEIKKKYLLRRQNMWYVKKINDIKKKEESTRESEMEEADALLDGL